LVGLAQQALFFLLLVLNLCELARKMRIICIIMKSDFPLFSATS